MQKICFFSEDSSFILKKKSILRNWISEIIRLNNKKAKAINYIFTSDNQLHTINQNYLNHDSLTDIITFDISIDPQLIETDIYISVDRVRDNATILNISFNEELHRVMVHGVLHILGYNDKSSIEKREMRKKENHYLALLK